MEKISEKPIFFRIFFENFSMFLLSGFFFDLMCQVRTCVESVVQYDIWCGFTYQNFLSNTRSCRKMVKFTEKFSQIFSSFRS